MTIALWKEEGGGIEGHGIYHDTTTPTRYPELTFPPGPLIIHVPLVLVCLLSHLSFSF